MRRVDNPRGPVLITGGAGFIGTNLASRLAADGVPVIIFDNLSRPGVEQNLQWLYDTYGDSIEAEIADVRNAAAVRRAVRHARQVFHFAAQVAVTHSLTDPVKDFETNVRGTLNVLEAIRQSTRRPALVFTSTNKVYGALSDVALSCGARYEPLDPALRRVGIGENRPLDFHSPYGCSKGAADQYVLDFARTFRTPAVVFRMSCIYGPHQHGNADQGWVAHFVRRSVDEEPLVLYGDGRQVRDVLFAADLVEAFLTAQREMDRISGQAFNIGGGPDHTISLLELLDVLCRLQGTRPAVTFDAWRLGDQKYYVSDIRRFCSATGWAPRVQVLEGIRRLFEWITHRDVETGQSFESTASAGSAS
jgi:CDP-paratose 2-epimerase